MTTINGSDGLLWRTVAADKDYYTVSGLILLISTILGTLGNGLVVTVIGRKGIPPTVTPIFIANLSTAHLCLSVLCMTLESAYLLLGGRWIFSQPICKAVIYVDCVMSSAAILTLSSIAIDRYYSVVYPLDRKLSLFKGAMMVTYTWTHAVIISLPKLFVARVNNEKCQEQWDGKHQAQIYLIIYTSLTIFGPLLLTCVAYYLVWRGFRSSHRRVNCVKPSKRHKPNSANMANALKTETRLMQTLSLMVFCFVVLWAPRVVYMFLVTFTSTQIISEYFFLTAFWLCKIQPVIDPFIYGYLNKHFRKHLRELIRACSVRCVDEIGIPDIVTSDEGEVEIQAASPAGSPQPSPIAEEMLDSPGVTAVRSQRRRVSLVSNVYTGPSYTFSFAAATVGMQATIAKIPEPDSNATQKSSRYEHRQRKKSRITKRLMKHRRRSPELHPPTIQIEDNQQGEVLFRVNLADHLKLNRKPEYPSQGSAWPTAGYSLPDIPHNPRPHRLPRLEPPTALRQAPFPLPLPTLLSTPPAAGPPHTPKPGTVTGSKRRKRKILSKRLNEKKRQQASSLITPTDQKY